MGTGLASSDRGERGVELLDGDDIGDEIGRRFGEENGRREGRSETPCAGRDLAGEMICGCEGKVTTAWCKLSVRECDVEEGCAACLTMTWRGPAAPASNTELLCGLLPEEGDTTDAKFTDPFWCSGLEIKTF